MNRINRFDLRHTFLFIILITVMSTMSSCRKAALSPSEYMIWAKENMKELSVVTVNNGLRYTCSFIPSDYYALRNSVDKSNVDMTSALFEYSKLFHLELVVKVDNSNSEGPTDVRKKIMGDSLSFDEYRHYMSHQIKHKLSLINRNQDLFPIDMHYEQSGNLMNEVKFAVVFDKTKMDNIHGFTVVLENGTILKNERLEFAFSERLLERIPRIKI